MMRRREFTPNDTRGVIRLLSFRYAGTARGRNRILLATVILCIVALTMVFGITRGKIRAEEDPGRRTECHPDSRDGSVRSRGRWKCIPVCSA